LILNYQQIGFKWLENAVEASRFSNFNKLDRLDRIQFLKILLLDIWILNSDRNAYNLNLLIQRINGKDRIIAIDHGMSFYSLPFNEFGVVFNSGIEISAQGSLLSVDDIRSLLAKTRGIQDMVNQAISEFEQSVVTMRLDLHLILSRIPQQWGIDVNHIQTVLNSTIFDRSWSHNAVRVQFLQYLKQMNII